MQRFKRTFLYQYSLKLRIVCLPKHWTKYPPMEGPHTNVGTWAPGYLATLLIQTRVLMEYRRLPTSTSLTPTPLLSLTLWINSRLSWITTMLMLPSLQKLILKSTINHRIHDQNR